MKRSSSSRSSDLSIFQIPWGGQQLFASHCFGKTTPTGRFLTFVFATVVATSTIALGTAFGQDESATDKADPADISYHNDIRPILQANLPSQHALKSP